MAINGHSGPRTPASKMDSNLEVGDQVVVPGEMTGTVKFLGIVSGKAGKFVGVELDEKFAARGKNDGDVDGYVTWYYAMREEFLIVHSAQYFTTSIPGAGIFLPVHRAEKRSSPSVSVDSFPGTPNTPSYSTVKGMPLKSTTTTPALPHKFSQTIGPGARPPSPNFKPKRPSLPRPESPFRRQPPDLAPTPAKNRNLSQSQYGSRAGTTPAKNNFKSSINARPSAADHTPRPYSRTGSRLGNRTADVLEVEKTPYGVSNNRAISQGSTKSFSQPLRSPSRLGSAGSQDQELQRLRSQLAEREKRLEEQAASLAEMEQSVKELSSIIPPEATTSTRKSSMDEGEEQTTAQLRQMLREKNEKISMLTAEFDAHRADFRSTLDSLEMASTETERVYEEQRRDLLARVVELEDLTQNKEDFEGVAQQLKQLEDLVAELEEGLEESRRGEAEARGELEFLRGEVERGRSELKREREKANAVKAAENSSSASKDIEQKDDEIRGLKAIIQSLSSNPNSAGSANGHTGSSDDLEELQSALDDVRKEKESLEQELEQIRRDATTMRTSGHTNGYANHNRNESERTATAPNSGMASPRARAETIKGTFAERARRSGIPDPTVNHVFCEMCESEEHDTLECDRFRNGEHTPGKENEHLANGRGKSSIEDEDKWCALCERDGHLAYDCPEENY